jgi:YVTN family beta-propeller protein
VAIMGVGSNPLGAGVAPATNTIYVSNGFSSSVSVISGQNNTVVATIHAGGFPVGVAADPQTNTVYVAQAVHNVVSVISGKTNLA